MTKIRQVPKSGGSQPTAEASTIEAGAQVSGATQAGGTRPCSIAASLQVLGERWALLAVREMFYGVHRFDQFVSFTGASRDILTDRLRKLESAGVVERRQYSEHPPRYEYHLTPAGDALGPVLLALSKWGDNWAEGPHAATFDHSCGHELDVVYVCRACRAPLTKGSVQIRSGKRA